MQAYWAEETYKNLTASKLLDVYYNVFIPKNYNWYTQCNLKNDFFQFLDDLTLEKETFLDFCDGDMKRKARQTCEII